MLEVASLTLSAAQTVIAAIQCLELKQLFSLVGQQSELVKLEETVKTVKAVLLDAQEATGEMNHQLQDLVEKLTSVMYDADDLLDKFNTVAKREMLRLSATEEAGESSKVSKKVRRLFSHFKMSRHASKMSSEVQKIREIMDEIANNANKFCFKVDNQPIRQRKEASCSYVNEPDIIGREDDTRKIVDMLLNPNFEEHSKGPPVITIVGMGGLGKTALAQLVFNDKTIQDNFQLRLWTCVSDQDQSKLNVEYVLGSILTSDTDEKYVDALSKEQLQNQLRKKLDGNKYLLVLDDVWTEERAGWLKLEELLRGGQRGSRIVVTTRSIKTATAVGSGDKLTYELGGLSEDDSWRLFEVTAKPEQANCPDLVDIGRSLVKRCVNVPLAIRVIGTLLYGQDKSKWQSFQNSRIFEIQNGENDILRILKFSYHHLRPSLKSCFSYCAIFPKDFVMKKEMLISLWMAQGYVETLDGGQGIEDAAAEHFRILVRRCFFQDVRQDEYGEVISCKIHDLMHDVAQGVANKEIRIANFNSMSSLDEKIRHISKVPRNCTKSFFSKSKIRTYLLDYYDYQKYGRLVPSIQQLPIIVKLLANLMCLRALDLSHLGIQSLPDTIGALVHLRYLDLSGNQKLEVLPKSITKLHNLQTLLLEGCEELRELPKEFCKLVHLRVLDTAYCLRLSYMPSGMKKLTGLYKLTMFKLGDRSSRGNQGFEELEDLGALDKLKGSLEINISKDYRYMKENHGEGAGYLRNKEHLHEIEIKWEKEEEDNYGGRVGEHEALLEDLQPHCNLKELSIWYYGDERIPRWGREDKVATSLRDLVKIELYWCERWQELPWLSKLRFLKKLKLWGLNKLEFVESSNNTSRSNNYGGGGGVGEIESSSSSASVIFYPSLEELELVQLRKLKGWWRGCGSGILPAFPRLSKLYLFMCPELTSIPPCPNLEDLSLPLKVNKRLRIKTKEDENERHDSKLKRVYVSKVGNLKNLPIQAFSCLTELEINGDNEVESMSSGDGGVVEEVIRTCSSSLHSLLIHNCSKLKSVSGGGGGLEYLSISNLPELTLDEDYMSWRSLGQSLRRLTLSKLPKMVELPKGMRHLTSLRYLSITCCPLEELPEWIGDGCFSSLQSLNIRSCYKLKSLPDAMRHLTSLTTLVIDGCPLILEKRCQCPNGEDWPKIQHIPNIHISAR